MSRRLTPQETKARLDKGEPIVFIDSRAPEAWARSHQQLPGSVRSPLVPLERFDESVAVLARDRTVIAYCT